MTTPVQIAPYGSWTSPISPAMAGTGSVGFSQIQADGDRIFWVESRPDEAGRSIVVCWDDEGDVTNVTPPEFNVRSSVHEYGGGAYTVYHDTVYFVNFADQQLYQQLVGQSPVQITRHPGSRYADMVIDPDRNCLIAVREDHEDGGPFNRIVSIDLANGSETILVTGSDFVSTPRLNPTGDRLLWLQWDHPRMPWDGTELMVAELDEQGVPVAATCVAGGEDESIFQPEWAPDGTLTFVSDRTGWWNLYQMGPAGARNLFPVEAEMGMPQWAFGMSTYAFLDDGQIACAINTAGIWQIGRLNPETSGLTVLDTDFAAIGAVRALADTALFVGGQPLAPTCVAALNMTSGWGEILRQSRDDSPGTAMISLPEPIAFPTDGGQVAHAFFYPPCNAHFVGPEDELPPLIVKSHGGPTAASSLGLSMDILFWTTRGFAVVDVNYRGSTGYGTAYRNALKGNWGVADVADCVNAAHYLVDQGRVDQDRLAIRGGSAGGYCTLSALAFHDCFRAGASYYGVSDTEALASDTHKFESRYLDGLIGPYPETRDVYRARSPIHHVDQLDCPLILLQGLEDRIVPPDQSETMYTALRERGLPVAYITYEGEQHGFRRAENIAHSLKSELCFYAAVFRFAVMGILQPVSIANLADEWFEVVDEDDTPCGLALRSVCHGHPELIHRTAHVVVTSSQGRLLLQKRTETKDIQPGKWDTAVGGHLGIGETYEEAARRETREELGIELGGPLAHLFDSRIRNAVESENVGVFHLVHAGPFQPDPDEVADLRFWTEAELRAAIGTGRFTPNLEVELDLLFEQTDLFPKATN